MVGFNIHRSRTGSSQRAAVESQESTKNSKSGASGFMKTMGKVGATLKNAAKTFKAEMLGNTAKVYPDTVNHAGKSASTAIRTGFGDVQERMNNIAARRPSQPHAAPSQNTVQNQNSNARRPEPRPAMPEFRRPEPRPAMPEFRRPEPRRPEFRQQPPLAAPERQVPGQRLDAATRKRYEERVRIGVDAYSSPAEHDAHARAQRRLARDFALEQRLEAEARAKGPVLTPRSIHLAPGEYHRLLAIAKSGGYDDSKEDVAEQYAAREKVDLYDKESAVQAWESRLHNPQKQLPPRTQQIDKYELMELKKIVRDGFDCNASQAEMNEYYAALTKVREWDEETEARETMRR